MRNYHLLAALSAIALSGCIYDASERCAPGEVLTDADLCVCAENHVPIVRDIKVIVPSDPTAAKPREGCLACGENEIAKGDVCACVDGFVRANGACFPSNLGAACESDADCVNGDNTKCNVTGGYCTTAGCTMNSDCNAEADYACDSTGAESFCRRPPLGQGDPCSMNGFDPSCPSESPMCVLGTCNPAGCTGNTECSPSRVCCDLSALAGQPLTLCMGGCP